MLPSVAVRSGSISTVSSTQFTYWLIALTVYADPCGVYEFNLGRSYERCCVLEILDIVAADPTVEVGSFEFCAEGPKGPFVPLKIAKFKERRREAIGREEKERIVLEGMRRINDIPYKLVFETVQVRISDTSQSVLNDPLCQKYDLDGSEMVKLSHVPKIFRELDIQYTSDFLAEIKFALDTREAGLVDVNELVEYVTKASVSLSVTPHS
jgi:hypothetical protein